MVGAPLKTSSAPTPPPAQKPKPISPAQEGRSPRRPGQWPTAVRALASVAIVWHFAGIFLAAMCIPGPTSPLVVDITEKGPMRWYLDALYLNQGHSFFAPDVGPAHLMQYECLDQNGQI